MPPSWNRQSMNIWQYRPGRRWACVVYLSISHMLGTHSIRCHIGLIYGAKWSRGRLASLLSPTAGWECNVFFAFSSLGTCVWHQWLVFMTAKTPVAFTFLFLFGISNQVVTSNFNAWRDSWFFFASATRTHCGLSVMAICSKYRNPSKKCSRITKSSTHPTSEYSGR